jgi:hypothetical protein
MKTIWDKVLFILAAAVSAWVACAAGYLYSVNPERTWLDLLPVAVVCIAWIARHSRRGDPGADPASRAKRRKITQAIVLAGLLLGMPLFARLGWPAGLELEFEKRSIGFMMGVMVMFASNAIPKQASSARGLAMRRIAGWALVLGGAGYALAWVLLPLAYVKTAALLILLFALTYAVVQIAWSMHKHRSVPPGRSG